MRYPRKDVRPITTVWEDQASGRARVAILEGHPCGVPRVGESVFVPELGEALCWAFSGPANAEVRLLLKRAAS